MYGCCLRAAHGACVQTIRLVSSVSMWFVVGFFRTVAPTEHMVPALN